MKKKLTSLEYPCSLCIINLDHSFDKYLLSVYYNSGTVLGAWDRRVAKTDNIFDFMDL